MRSSACARSGLATPETGASASPSSLAPRYWAISPAVWVMATSRRKDFPGRDKISERRPLSHPGFESSGGNARHSCSASERRNLKRIDRLLTRRARLPPLVDPNPLIRMFGDVVFNDASEARSVLADVRLFVAGSSKFDGR